MRQIYGEFSGAAQGRRLEAEGDGGATGKLILHLFFIHVGERPSR